MVCLDVETTGLDSINDKIIEIAIVRFDKGKILEEFHSLINPGFAIPEAVTHITGIRDSDLENAPYWEDIRAKIQSYIQKEPIMGHNIGFDIDFLSQNGITIEAPLIDTYDLGRILLPREHSYSLEILCKKYGIFEKQTHRALDDVKANISLFEVFKKEIAKIKPELLNAIIHLVNRSNWTSKIVFEEISANQKKRKVKKEIKKKLKKEKTEKVSTEEIKFSREEVLKYLKKSSKLLKIIPDYEERESQLEMAEKVAETFEQNKNLICEAGTGTGKSLAYLLPSALFSLEHNEKVVISTHTKTLQNQLFEKDVPLLQKIINKGDDFSVALLKGRKNYLSLSRFKQFIEKPSFEDNEIILAIKVLLWLEETVTGDVEELSLSGKENYAWYDVCCDEHYCFHDKSDNECFLNSARKQAEKANIVIVNHALLLTDTTTQSRLIPYYQHLIIDEAHNIEEDATMSFTIEIQKRDFDYTLNYLKNEKAKNIQSKIDILFGILGIFYEKETGYQLMVSDTYGEYAPELLLEAKNENTQEWDKIIKTFEGIEILYQDLAKEFEEEKDARKKAHIKKLGQKVEELKTIFLIKEGRVRSIIALRNGILILKSAPMEVADILNNFLFEDKKNIVLTSATLSVAYNGTEKEFSYIKTQLGLKDNFEELMLPSPFDYKKQVKIIIPKDIPEQGREGHFEAYTNVIAEAAKFYGGKILVLFTSKKSIEAAYSRLTIPLRELGVNVLAQEISGGKGKILAHFIDHPENSIIFGTSTFWEGIDLKGEILKCVIIQKLPFDRLNDPILVKRSQKYENAFEEFTVPRAILRLKQGFGRLIRSETDTGTIILLDTRVLSQNYGKRFLNSLPAKTPIIKAATSEFSKYL